MTKVQPVRQFQWLYAIADARRGSDVKVKRLELDAAERSVNVRPVNVTGQIDQHMVSQVAELVAQKREILRWLESLEFDDLARHYCAQEIAQVGMSVAPELRNSDGSPLARGARPAPIAPGMA